MKRILLCAACAVALYGCSKRMCDSSPVPQSISFHIVDPGLDLDSAQMTWFENGVMRSENVHDVRLNMPLFGIEYPGVRTDPAGQVVVDSTRPVLRSSVLIDIAAGRGVDTFYIVYKNRERDTLAVEAEIEEGKSGGCRYSRPHLHHIKYRGVSLQPDTGYLGRYYPVYELKRN